MHEMNRYTNIRYHIYKELSKYRKLQERRGSDRIIEFAIPIITGIVVVLITNRLIIRFKDINSLCYLGLIIVTVIGYGIILWLTKTIFYYVENKFIPNLRPIKRIPQNDLNYSPIQEENAAKFNYEVTYLVESAYCHANKIDQNDGLLFRSSLLHTLFCIKNALRKMNESLLGPSGTIDNDLVSYSMIKVVLEMISATLSTIQSYNDNKIGNYNDEIEFVLGIYIDTKKQIEIEYQIKE